MNLLQDQVIFHQLYQYLILKGNASYLVKYCMYHRVNWIEGNPPDPENSQIFNFKWKELSLGIDYYNLNKNPKMKQMVNHFEFHHVISNKANLFINLMKHAEIMEENVFKYIPFTLLFEYGSDNFFLMMDNFEKVFNSIDKYLVPFNDMDLSRYKFFKNRIFFFKIRCWSINIFMFKIKSFNYF